MADESGVWVYAVARGVAPEWFSPADGVAGEPVRVVEAGPLSAAVTTVSLAEFGEQALRRHLEDLDWLGEVARTHHHVIDVVAHHGPVLPMRLATVCLSDAGVVAMLEQRQEAFTAALGRVAGRAEWGVKISATTAGFGGSAEAAESAAEVGGPGAAFLRRKRRQLTASESARRAAATSAEDIDRALSRLAVASYARPPQHHQLTGRAERMIFNAAYLVDEQASAEFAATVQGLKEEHPELLTELTGPWPPYSFATLDTGEDRNTSSAGGPGAVSAVAPSRPASSPAASSPTASMRASPGGRPHGSLDKP